jgi:hypothetical protein
MDSDRTSSLGLTKVVLYKHGIGYFERRGQVTGPTKINLVCEASEIDDMLKSLLALAGNARIDAVTYDSSKTLESRLEEFGFDISNSEGLSGLLAQMKGIPVTVTASGETISGRMLGLEASEQIVNEHVLREKQVVLYSQENSFKRLALSSITAIKVEDETMASELRQQLDLLFQNAKKKDRKALSVILSEPGEHEVLIAYSIPCPIWKTSYRLVMKEKSKVMLQGMAIVDNTQEEDWADVQIVLVSASPISFIQPLYDPVQPERARIAAQGSSSAGPVMAERASRRAQPAPAAAPVMSARARDAGAVQRSETWGALPGGAGGMVCGFAQQEVASAEMSDMLAENFAESLQVETGEKGELFEYRVSKPVTIPRRSSALIPIVQQNIEGERISLFNEGKNSKFPFAAIRFVNNTGLTLEGGPVTVMEGDIYAGEALLDTTKPDDKRFLLYAVDQSCPVTVRYHIISRPHWRVRCLNGVLFLDFRLCNEKYYEIENLSELDKIIYIEHQVRQGWTIVSKPAPAETTEHFYRFSLDLAAKNSIKLTVAEESDSYEQLVIYDPFNLDVNKIDWVCGQNFVDPEFVKFLRTLMEKRTEIQVLQTEFSQQQQLLEQYTKDQARARENLKSLGASAERYRKIIDSTEDQINDTNKKIQSLTVELAQQHKLYQELALTRFVSELTAAGKKSTK